MSQGTIFSSCERTGKREKIACMTSPDNSWKTKKLFNKIHIDLDNFHIKHIIPNLLQSLQNILAMIKVHNRNVSSMLQV